MMVSVPVAAAGGPPETGASIQRQLVRSASFSAKARPLSTLMVEKSTTTCGGSSERATPVGPNIAVSTASVVGRFSSTACVPAAVAAGESATLAPAATAASTLAWSMS